MKKLVGIIAVLLCAGITFAQNTNAAELLKKAKNYEAEKKLVYAICSYYDVLEIDANNSEAANGYEKLTNIIKSGKPGLGEYDEFQLRDGWFALRREWEKYWTENCPFRFELAYPEKGDVNYEKKTATYSVDVGTLRTEKFKQLDKIFVEGIEKSYKRGWGFMWNSGFVFSEKDGDPFQIYQKYGVAIVKYRNKNIKTNQSYRLSADEIEMISRGNYYDTETYRGDAKDDAYYVCSALSTGMWFPQTSIQYHYELEVCICDADGKILTTTKGYAKEVQSDSRETAQFIFKNLNLSAMEKIDSGRCSVKVNSVYILYGTVDGLKLVSVGWAAGFDRFEWVSSGLKKIKTTINPEENENNPAKKEMKKQMEEKRIAMEKNMAINAALSYIANSKVYDDGYGFENNFTANFKYKNLSTNDIRELFREMANNEYIGYTTYTPNVAAAKEGAISNSQQLVDMGYTKIAVHPTKGNKLAIKNTTYDPVELDFWSVEKENKSKGKNHLAKGKSVKINSGETYSGNPLSDKLNNLTEFYVKALRYTGIQIVDIGTDGKNQTLSIIGKATYPKATKFLVLTEKGKEFLQNSQAK